MLHRADLAVEGLRAQLQRALVGLRGILHAHRERACGRSMHARERLREAVGLAVHDEVDAPLAIEQHVLRAVARHGHETQLLEERAQLPRIRRRVFDELEAVGAHGIFERAGGVCHRVSSSGGWTILLPPSSNTIANFAAWTARGATKLRLLRPSRRK
jgi:hypothetical protein